MKANSWIEISKENLLHNLRTIKKQINGSKLIFIVKANAYGHGIKEVTQITEKAKNLVNAYGVHSLEEAILLRNLGIKKDIFVLGYINFANLEYIIDYQLIPTITNLETLEHIEKIAEKKKKNVRLNLKCETGTFRQGILFKDFPHYLSFIKKSHFITLEGLTTHFANIEDTIDHSYAEMQLETFKKFVNVAEKEGFKALKNHIACSAAILLFKETHYQMVRAGISSYGYWSSNETKLSALLKNENIILKPVLSWKTIVGQIKEVEAGNYIGYGGTYKTTHKTKLAILPVGYSDGYDRKLSNIGYVLINGKRAPIRGRVCMNMTIVDVTDIPVKLEDEVVLIGSSKEEIITANEIAQMTNTINYEVISRIRDTIKRIII